MKNRNRKEFQKKIKPLRDKIDRIDTKILSLLVARQKQVEKIFLLKGEYSMPVFHPIREEKLISQLRLQAVTIGMDPDFVESLYKIILNQSRIKQLK